MKQSFHTQMFIRRQRILNTNKQSGKSFQMGKKHKKMRLNLYNANLQYMLRSQDYDLQKNILTKLNPLSHYTQLHILDKPDNNVTGRSSNILEKFKGLKSVKRDSQIWCNKINLCPQ